MRETRVGPCHLSSQMLILKWNNPGFIEIYQSIRYQGLTWLIPKTPGDLQTCCVLGL